MSLSDYGIRAIAAAIEKHGEYVRDGARMEANARVIAARINANAVARAAGQVAPFRDAQISDRAFVR